MRRAAEPFLSTHSPSCSEGGSYRGAQPGSTLDPAPRRLLPSMPSSTVSASGSGVELAHSKLTFIANRIEVF